MPRASTVAAEGALDKGLGRFAVLGDRGGRTPSPDMAVRSALLAFHLHAYRCVVGVQDFGLEHFALHLRQDGPGHEFVDRDQHVPHGLLRQVQASALVDALQAIQRQVVEVLAGHDVGVDRGVVLGLWNHSLGRLLVFHLMPVRAGIANLGVATDEESGRDIVSTFRNILSDSLQRLLAAAADPRGLG